MYLQMILSLVSWKICYVKHMVFIWFLKKKVFRIIQLLSQSAPTDLSYQVGLISFYGLDLLKEVQTASSFWIAMTLFFAPYFLQLIFWTHDFKQK